MMAKMKAETGMGMKMYKREAWCWVLLAFGCDRCWYDLMQDLMHMSEGDMETMAAREAGNGCTPFFRCCLLQGASSRNLSKFSWVFNHEPQKLKLYCPGGKISSRFDWSGIWKMVQFLASLHLHRPFTRCRQEMQWWKPFSTFNSLIEIQIVSRDVFANYQRLSEICVFCWISLQSRVKWRSAEKVERCQTFRFLLKT